MADFAGLTRDRKYGEGLVGERPYLVIDTGGLTGEDEGITSVMAQQAQLAILDLYTGDIAVFKAAAAGIEITRAGL